MCSVSQEIKNQKTEAHRKQVKIRKTKDTTAKATSKEAYKTQDKTVAANPTPSTSKEQEKLPPIADMSKDRLRSEVENDGSLLESKAITKKDLKRLCTAHGVSYSTKMRKGELVNKLKTSILEKQPNSDLEALTENAEGYARKNPVRESRKRKMRQVEFPCAVCGEECECDCVCCDRCNQWIHYCCIDLDGDEEELQHDTWHCQNCQE